MTSHITSDATPSGGRFLLANIAPESCVHEGITATPLMDSGATDHYLDGKRIPGQTGKTFNFIQRAVPKRITTAGGHLYVSASPATFTRRPCRHKRTTTSVSLPRSMPLGTPQAASPSGLDQGWGLSWSRAQDAFDGPDSTDEYSDIHPAITGLQAYLSTGLPGRRKSAKRHLKRTCDGTECGYHGDRGYPDGPICCRRGDARGPRSTGCFGSPPGREQIGGSYQENKGTRWQALHDVDRTREAITRRAALQHEQQDAPAGLDRQRVAGSREDSFLSPPQSSVACGNRSCSSRLAGFASSSYCGADGAFSYGYYTDLFLIRRGIFPRG